MVLWRPKLSDSPIAERCPICFDRYEVSFDRWSCRCGQALHLSCARIAGICPVCRAVPFGELPRTGPAAQRHS